MSLRHREGAARHRAARRGTSALAALLALASVAVAGQDALPRVGIRDSELRQLDSAILGERLEIDVALPRGYEKEAASYPVVYVLDAETNFGATSYIARRLTKNGDIPAVLVVGVAYDTTYEDFYVKRARDLTPVATSRFPGSGGAARFARVLEREVFPFVAAHYRVLAGDRTLYGHSFGGLFALYVLFEHPGLFQRVIALSPSIWYARRDLVSREKAAYERARPPRGILYTAVGADESEYFVEDWRELTARLRSRPYPALHLKSENLAGENHRSIFGAAFTNGLCYVFSAAPPAHPEASASPDR
jgi:predicted alpha/beta superfamily hydrolase